MAAILEHFRLWTQHVSTAAIALATLLVVLVAYRLIISSSRNKYQSHKKPRRPPSPWALPVIGNLHQLLPSPHRSLASLAGKYGPVMTIRMGSARLLIISTAAAAAEALKTHDLVFSSRPRTAAAERLVYSCRDVIMSPYGERWRQARRICVVHLLSPSRVRQICRVWEEEVLAMLGHVAVKAKTGEVVNVSTALHELANHVTSRFVFGKSYWDEDGVRELFSEHGVLLGEINIADIFPWLAWINRFNGFESRAAKTMRGLDALFEQEIQDRVRLRQRNRSTVSSAEPRVGSNFVDVLLSLEPEADGEYSLFDRDVLKAVLLDMMGAGTHTTSAAMDWTMTELMRHPQVREKLTQEIRSASNWGKDKKLILEEDIERLPYLQCVIKEVFRMHPPGPLLVPRETTDDVEVMGYHIPQGTRVLINAWAIHHDPEIWNSPDEFRPERFADGAVDFKGLDFKLIPFGAGRRGCPGISLASQGIYMAIANLLLHFDFELPEGTDSADLDMSEAAGFTTNRKYNLAVTATRAVLK